LRGLNWEPLPVYGDGRHVRDWIHVEDHCEAIWLIVNEGKAGETYNVGARGEMENIELVGLICDILDEMVPPPKGKRRRDLITFVEDRPGHDRRYAIDATKITEELHWRPRRTLEEGLRETIKWYLENPQWVSQVQSGEYMRWIEEHYGGRR